jgi:IS30 family transposase
MINKCASSVSRYVRENGSRDNYGAKEVRRKKYQKRILSMESIRVIYGTLLRSIVILLKEHFSPEQISGSLERKGKHVDSSTVYRYIDEQASHLKQYLRSQKGKYRRKRGTKIKEKEGELKKKRRIDECPSVIDRRGRIGDFEEGDPVLGKDKRVRIVMYVDRRTGHLITFLLPKTNAELIAKLTIKKFSSLPTKKRKTVTFDNGTEFSGWESIVALMRILMNY